MAAGNETTLAVNQVRVMLLCPPRATSTIFTRCMSAVPNAEIFYDNYVPCKHAENCLTDMGKTVDYQADDIPEEDWRKAADMFMGEDCTGRLNIELLKFPMLKKALVNPSPEKKFVFCKTVSYGLVDKYHFLPDASSKYRYSFLLRHPIRVFSSWRRAMFDVYSAVPNTALTTRKSWDNFHMWKDVHKKYIYPGRFFKETYDLWKYVKKNLDPNPVIIDSDELLSDPAVMMSKYCEALGIPYSDDMLVWDGKPDFAESWVYPFRPILSFKLGRIFLSNALNATGFKPPRELASLNDVTDDVRESVEFVKTFYEEMYNERIRP